MIQLATNQVMASCGIGNFSVSWPILTHFTWKIFVFWLKCHRNLFLVVQLKICNQWLRHRLGTKPATSYCLDDQTIVARWSQGHNKFTVLVGLLIRGGSPVLMSRDCSQLGRGCLPHGCWYQQGHNKFTVLVGLLIRGGSPVLMSRDCSQLGRGCLPHGCWYQMPRQKCFEIYVHKHIQSLKISWI